MLVEGYKDLPLPKIEVRRRVIGGPPIAHPLARVSDTPGTDGVPTISFEDREAIVDTVLRIAGLSRGRH